MEEDDEDGHTDDGDSVDDMVDDVGRHGCE